MGKSKTDRTDEQKIAVMRRIITADIKNTLERRRFNRLVKAGLIVRE